MSARRLEAFRALVGERLARLNVAWIQLEQGAGDSESASAIDDILRDLHTLKGEASLLGFQAAADVAHALEDALQGVAGSGRAPDDETGDKLLRGLDLIGELVRGAPEAGSEAATSFLEELAGSPAPKQARTTHGRKLPERAEPEDAKVAASGTAVRVTAAQLDRMRNMIGDLLLSRTRLSKSVSSLAAVRAAFAKDRPETGELDQMLATISTGLRDEVMRMGNLVTALEDVTRELRMVPLSMLFDRYPRAVRELARELGKRVRLSSEGQAMEADREVLEALDEPLLHLVRNAIDHGIEDPETRRRLGKPEVGTLSLRAHLKGGSLHLDIEDDGSGIDIEAVRKAAVQRGLLEPASASVLSDERVLECLLAPGMSTKETVTQVSGRGVGLDVLNTALRSLGGTLRISTERGVGTTFHIVVPVTVAISSVVLFQVGAGYYGLLASTVIAIVDESSYPEVDSIHGPAVRYDDRLVPLVELHDVLQEPEPNAVHLREGRLILASASGGLVALAGTRGHLQRDAVLKVTAGFLDPHRLATAGVVLEDGSVALVLNPTQLLTLARRRPPEMRTSTDAAIDAARTILVADDSPVILDVISETLRGYGMTVIEANDGEEALAQLEAHPEVDLLVTDVEMPRMNGLQLIKAIRTRGGSRRIPAIVVSTRGSDADKHAAVEVGADAYLVKSDFTREGLWSLVARFLA